MVFPLFATMFAAYAGGILVIDFESRVKATGAHLFSEHCHNM